MPSWEASQQLTTSMSALHPKVIMASKGARILKQISTCQLNEHVNVGILAPNPQSLLSEDKYLVLFLTSPLSWYRWWGWGWGWHFELPIHNNCIGVYITKIACKKSFFITMALRWMSLYTIPFAPAQAFVSKGCVHGSAIAVSLFMIQSEPFAVSEHGNIGVKRITSKHCHRHWRKTGKYWPGLGTRMVNL